MSIVARVDSFDLEPGSIIADKYVVLHKLGDGWEGEVYRVREKGTGVETAAKVFFPQRNKDRKAMRFTAKKLYKLRKCGIVMQYHGHEEVHVDDVTVDILFSELIEGVMLERYVEMQRGKRVHPYEALHILHALAKGVACVHTMREYHGDIHEKNIMVSRRGVWFDVRLIDAFNYGKATPLLMSEDVIDCIRVFYDILGGQKYYAGHPQWVKDICCGLRKGSIRKKFRNATHLAAYLDQFSWE